MAPTRKSLIRLARSHPAGSPERRTLLAVLTGRKKAKVDLDEQCAKDKGYTDAEGEWKDPAWDNCVKTFDNCAKGVDDPEAMCGYIKSRKKARNSLVRVAHEHPETRPLLIPMILAADEGDDKPWSKLPKGWTQKSLKSFWDTLTGDVKHKVTKCMKQMDGKVSDTGAYCGSLADKMEPGWRSRGREATSRRAYGTSYDDMLAFAEEAAAAAQRERWVDAIRALQKIRGWDRDPVSNHIATAIAMLDDASYEAVTPRAAQAAVARVLQYVKDWPDAQGSGYFRSAAMERQLRAATIRLAHENPSLRPHLLPLLEGP